MVPIPRKARERSCICALELLILPFSTIYLKVFRLCGIIVFYFILTVETGYQPNNVNLISVSLNSFYYDMVAANKEANEPWVPRG